MKNVTVLGHFGFGKELLNGQTVKTKIITEALKAHLGDAEVSCMDTHGGWKTLLKAPAQVLVALATSKNVVILPAHNGVRVFGTLLSFMRPLFRGRKLHYVVIGGWLPAFLEKRHWLSRRLRSFDGIYVETRVMQRMLEDAGFTNIVWMTNCKDLKILTPKELICSDAEPFRLCTFSRVSQKKGISDAVEAVKAVNEHFGATVCTLDIYGPVDRSELQWFDQLQKDFSDAVRYGGLVPYDRSVEVLKDYYALLFPTLSATEGIPGTIIDAYAAGVPVIAARWESVSDIVIESITGWGYTLGDASELYRCILEAVQNPQRWNGMRLNCLREAEKYRPEKVIECITAIMEGD